VSKGQEPNPERKGKKPKPRHRVKNPILEHYMLVARLVAAVMGDKRDFPHIADGLRQKFMRFATRGNKKTTDNEKDRKRLQLDKRIIEVSVREELTNRRAQIASPKDTSQPKKL
jgi:hypothetical protein